jgi:hypothetical protein
VGGAAGAEEPLDAGEQPLVVVRPAHAGAGSERVDEHAVVGVTDAMVSNAPPRKTGLSSFATTMACSAGSSWVPSAGV